MNDAHQQVCPGTLLRHCCRSLRFGSRNFCSGCLLLWRSRVWKCNLIFVLWGWLRRVGDELLENRLGFIATAHGEKALREVLRKAGLLWPLLYQFLEKGQSVRNSGAHPGTPAPDCIVAPARPSLRLLPGPRREAA